MTAEIIKFPGITRLDMPPDPILEEAIGTLEGVVILGYTKEGEEFFASSYAGGPEVLWLLERAKLHLLSVVDDDGD